MKPRPIILLAAVAASPAAAQPGPASPPPTIEVKLSSFAFTPSTIRLRAGQPTTLHLVNSSSGGHNFSAPEFFAAAQLTPETAALVSRGRVEVPKRAARDVSLVPRAGHYRLKCTHTFHTSFGMKGEIIVE